MAHTRLARSAGRFVLLAACAAISNACGGESAASRDPLTSADSQAAHVADVVAQGGVVDSILPIAEHLRRFRATVASHPDTLSHTSPSARALVARWAKAVGTSDTTALNAMVIDRAEFAWLYYDDSPMSKPPYEAPPELLWGQIMASSNEGAKRVQGKFGGKPVEVVDLMCPAASTEGANRIHQNCVVTVRTSGATLPTARYFGSIIERGGRFKFISLANRL